MRDFPVTDGMRPQRVVGRHNRLRRSSRGPLRGRFKLWWIRLVGDDVRYGTAIAWCWIVLRFGSKIAATFTIGVPGDKLGHPEWSAAWLISCPSKL